MAKWKKPKGNFKDETEYFRRFYDLNKDKIIDRFEKTGIVSDEKGYKDYFNRFVKDAKNSLERRKKYSGKDYNYKDVLGKVLKSETIDPKKERDLFEDINKFKKSKVYKAFRTKSKIKGRYVKTNIENAIEDGTFTINGRRYTRYKIDNEAGTFYILKAQSPTDETDEFYFYSQDDWDNMASDEWEEVL